MVLEFITRPISKAAYELLRTIGIFVYRLAGWRFATWDGGERKMVVIAAPHTSNWDLPLMLACAVYYRVPLKWMGKHTLFKPPWTGFMNWLGGIPIDRTKNNDVVAQMIEVYDAADALAVAIPPEGTRAKVRYWKSGFYNIAHGAGVPIALGFLDYKNKRGGIGGMLTTTGDYDADLEKIKAFYAPITPKHERNEEGQRLR